MASITAQRYLEKNQRQLEDSMKALASGTRLSTPQNDAAGFAISEMLRAQVAGLGQAAQNARTAQAFIQTAEGGLSEQNNILVRMRELAVSAASDSIGDQERGFVNEEFTLLVSEFDRIAKSTKFGSKNMLSGSDEEFTFQVGPNQGSENEIKFKLSADTQASSVGIDGLDISDQDSARGALGDIDEAVMKVAGTRAKLGGEQSRMMFAIDNLETQKQNNEEARSIIADVDVAEETSKLARASLLQDAGMAVLTQANSYPKKLLQLIA